MKSKLWVALTLGTLTCATLAAIFLGAVRERVDINSDEIVASGVENRSKVVTWGDPPVGAGTVMELRSLVGTETSDLGEGIERLDSDRVVIERDGKRWLFRVVDGSISELLGEYEGGANQTLDPTRGSRPEIGSVPED